MILHLVFSRAHGIHHDIPHIQNAGFDARLDNEGNSQSGLSHSRSIRKWRNTFIFSLVFGVPTMIVAFMPITWPIITPGLNARDVILFTLASIIQVLVLV